MNLRKKPNFIVLCSGKGGVGKSVSAISTAIALSKTGKRTALIDLDIRGPSIANITDMNKNSISAKDNEISFIQFKDNLDMISLKNIPGIGGDDVSVTWKPIQSYNMGMDFIGRAIRDRYEYIVLDFEASSGELLKSVIQTLQTKGHKRIHAIAVLNTTDDAVRRTKGLIKALFQLEVHVLGSIENMGKEGERSRYYMKMVKDLQKHNADMVDIGKINFNFDIRDACDSGKIDLSDYPVFKNIVRLLEEVE